MKNRHKTLLISLLTLVIISCVSISYALAFATTSVKLEGYDLLEEYCVGDSIEIPDAKIKAEGSLKDTLYKTQFPDGSFSKESFINLNTVGKYTVFYYTKDGKYNISKNFIVKNTLYAVSNGLGSVNYEANLNTDSGSYGLTVTLNQGSSFYYNKVIDLSKNSKDKEFLNLYFLPNEIGTADYTNFFIKLTDVYDDENYILITCQSTHWTRENCYVSAGANDQPRVGLENGYAHKNNAYGFLAHTSFFGQPFANKSLEEASLKLYFDYKEMQLLGKPGFDNHSSLITDFNDPLLYTDLWNGFTTGEVYLSAYTGSNIAATGTFVILNVNGDDLSADIIEDNTAPNIIIDSQGYESAPNALIHNKYPIYKAIGMDEYSGYLKTSARVYYGYQTVEQKEYVIQDGEFTPDKVGEYTVEYSSSDNFGNTSYKTYKVSCLNSLEELKINLLETGENYFVDREGQVTITGKVVNGTVGKAVYIAQYEALGGSGSLDACVTVTTPYGETIAVEGDFFIPVYAGEYAVTYTVVDYISQEESLSYKVNVLQSDGPVFDECSFPLKYIFSNRPTTLPEMHAYDIFCGVKVPADLSVSAYDSNGREIEVNNFVINPQVENGETIKLVYTASTIHGKTTKSFEVTAVEPTSNKINISEYFRVTKGEIVTEVLEENVTLNFDSESAFEWLFPVVADSFDILMTSKEVNFGAINFYLTDSKYHNEQLKISLTSGNQSEVSLNGGKPVALKNIAIQTNSASQIGFTLSTLTKTIEFMNGDSGVELNLTNYLDGGEFTGFSSGKIYIEVEFVDVVGQSSMNIYSISGQLTKRMNYDIVKPKIKFLSAVEYYKTTMGEKASTSVAVAGDVLDCYLDFSLTAYAPGGVILKDIYGNEIKEVSPSYTYEYYLENYGSYIFVYTAEDWSGNKTTQTISITLYDTEKPVITLDGEVASKLKVGESLYIPNATASDNSSDKLTIYIYVRTPLNKIIYLDRSVNDSFTLASAGNYYLTYVCYDEAGNMTVNEYLVQVSKE